MCTSSHDIIFVSVLGSHPQNNQFSLPQGQRTIAFQKIWDTFLQKPNTIGECSKQPKDVAVLLWVLGKRWTLRILWKLTHQRLTFRALQKNCGEISPTVLNARPKDLRALGLVDLADDGYGQTAHGKSLGRRLISLDKWAEAWAEEVKAD